MIGLIACLLGFAVLIYLSYKDWSIYLAAFAAACVVIFLTGMPFVETLTDTFISGMAQSLKSFFFLLLFGNIEAALYRDSGAGFSIATGIMKKLIRPNASSKARVLTGLSIILVICRHLEPWRHHRCYCRRSGISRGRWKFLKCATSPNAISWEF